ncbi:glycosyltransferase family 4 protein [Trichlorobacter lovleyi]|uniref:glycosyltransferase family 4 protein n=1 Tax=Trichlorobacter lovleyi TaxID=313985 RepID=UPI003D0AEE42
MIVTHANHLVSLGNDVCFMTSAVDTVFTLDPRITITLLSPPHKPGTILSALTSMIAADLIIADIIPIACCLFFRNHSKVVYFAQDYDESYYSSLFLKGIMRCCYFLGLALFRIPVIAVSRTLADILKQRFSAQVTVAENGVDTTVFFSDPMPNLIAMKGGRRALLILSRGDWRKGFDCAQSVVHRFAETSYIPFEIWTVGESCVGLFPGCTHHHFGYVDEEQLRQIMSSADVLLYPTRHEGFGLMPLEAMACGCPVVTTTAVPYVVHGDNALVTQIENCQMLVEYLQELLVDDTLRHHVTESGRRCAAQHTLSDATRQFAKVLTGI